MAITEQRKPYEFLVRWDELTGSLKGAHIQFYDALLRDGARISGQPSRAYGVGEGMAFPLADILTQVQIDALAELDVRAATISTRDATIATLTSERDAAQARIAELEAQVAAASGTETDSNGIPVRVPMAAGRIALSRAGKLADFKAALAAIPGQPGEEAREWFEYSSHIERQHPTVIAMTPLIGTSADVDALFIAAAAIAAGNA
jgi:hypothetical protein